jgi:hypothetical protein
VGNDMFLEFTFKSEDGVRLNDYRGQDMIELAKIGENFVAKNKVKLQEMIKPIVDQRYKGQF